MVPPGPRPPPDEVELGLEFYATATAGVPAEIKSDPDDFRVDEISRYPLPDPDGPYTVLRVVSRDWEQHELTRALARAVGVRPSAIAWAGTKDRRAISERLVSFRGPWADVGIGLPRVEVVEAYRARDGLSLGHLYGNSFRIRLIGTSASDAGTRAALEATREALASMDGIPNFFGPQRFGEVRPVTHLVGRELVRSDPEAAVELYLAARVPGGQGPGDEARRAYAEHHDPARALREFPESYRFERILLERLAEGRTPARALMALPRDLRRLFVHAYQSFLFNRLLCRRVASGRSLTVPEPGDHVVRLGADGTPSRLPPIAATADNAREVGETTKRQRGVVAGPLLGFATPSLDGWLGATVGSLLEEESVSRAAFALPALPGEASEGAWRAFTVPPPPIGLIDGADPNFVLRFALPKGSYATVLSREFVKRAAS